MKSRLLIIIGIVIALAIITPFLIILGSHFIPVFYFEAAYPDWDLFCSDVFHVENYSSYDEGLLEKITRQAIAEKYPDMPIPKNLVIPGHDTFDLIHLPVELHTSGSMITGAFEENSIKAEYLRTGCS